MSRYDIGFLGGGQLARMSVQAAQMMGLRCLTLDPDEVTPASQIAESLVGDLSDPAAIAELIGRCERVTLENEFTPANAIEEALDLSGRDHTCMAPGLECLGLVQDKLLQRRSYERHAVASPRAVPIEGDGSSATQEIGFPMVLKARFGGYDGKATQYAISRKELEGHRELWSRGGWIAEQFVSFTREIAVIVCRSRTQTACFPTMQTVQSNHVCDHVFPSGVDARDLAIAAVEAVGGYGLFGVELFEVDDGEHLVNEIAPRPHNSGHYTLDWGGISQFEAHVRLVMGLRLPGLTGHDTCMANILGQVGTRDYREGLRASIEEDADVRLHWYGKLEARVGRKLGHINVPGERCVERALAARQRFYRAWRDA